jgi:hypothetical protein
MSYEAERKATTASGAAGMRDDPRRYRIVPMTPAAGWSIAGDDRRASRSIRNLWGNRSCARTNFQDGKAMCRGMSPFFFSSIGGQTSLAAIGTDLKSAAVTCNRSKASSRVAETATRVRGRMTPRSQPEQIDRQMCKADVAIFTPQTD